MSAADHKEAVPWQMLNSTLGSVGCFFLRSPMGWVASQHLAQQRTHWVGKRKCIGTKRPGHAGPGGFIQAATVVKAGMRSRTRRLDRVQNCSRGSVSGGLFRSQDAAGHLVKLQVLSLWTSENRTLEGLHVLGNRKRLRAGSSAVPR